MPLFAPPAAGGGGSGTTDHDALTNVSADDHHAELHAATHATGAADALAAAAIGAAAAGHTHPFDPHSHADNEIPASIARDTEVTAAVAAHAALADPHTGYATDADLTNHAATAGHTHPNLAAHDSLGLATQAELETHAATPHGGGSHPDLAAHDTLGLATQTELDNHAAAADPHGVYQLESEKAAANGYASLDAATLVPRAQLGTGTPGSTVFLRGDATWAAPAGSTPGTFGNLAAPAATSLTTETLLFRFQVPAGNVAVGDTFDIKMAGVSSSTGTLIFRIRVGALGTTGDAQAWISTTSAAQVANAHAGIDLLLTVRSLTTVIADGMAHAGAVLLPTLIGAAATATIVSSAAWWIDITATASLGTFTAQVASIAKVN